MVCSWALILVRVVVIGTFFSDRVGLLRDRAVGAKGRPGRLRGAERPDRGVERPDRGAH